MTARHRTTYGHIPGNDRTASLTLTHGTKELAIVVDEWFHGGYGAVAQIAFTPAAARKLAERLLDFADEVDNLKDE